MKQKRLITNSYIPREAYRYERKNKYPTIGERVSDPLFLSVIKNVNLVMADELLKGNIVKFPMRMGTLQIGVRDKTTSKNRFGHYVTTKSINWKKTRELWEKEPDLKEKGAVVFSENSAIPKVKFDTSNSNCANHTFYQFRVTLDLMHRAHTLIDSGESGLIFK